MGDSQSGVTLALFPGLLAGSNVVDLLTDLVRHLRRQAIAKSNGLLHDPRREDSGVAADAVTDEALQHCSREVDTVAAEVSFRAAFANSPDLIGLHFHHTALELLALALLCVTGLSLVVSALLDEADLVKVFHRIIALHDHFRVEIEVSGVRVIRRTRPFWEDQVFRREGAHNSSQVLVSLDINEDLCGYVSTSQWR